jgi:hypothetical protein
MWWSLRRLGCAAAVALPLLALRGAAQSCCGVPTIALGGTERGVNAVGTLTLGARYQYIAFGRSYNGSAPAADPLARTAYGHTFVLEAEYTALPRVAFLLALPFVVKERRLQQPEPYRYRASGIGDAFALVKYSVPLPLGEQALSAGAGVKFPTGDSHREADGVQLPRDVQPGTGTWELLLWLWGSSLLADGLASATASLLVRFPATASRLVRSPTADEFFRNGSERFRNGSELQLSGTLAWLDCPIPGVLPALALQWRQTEPDELNGRMFPASGGKHLELRPTLTLQREPFALQLSATLPILRRTYGLQLVSTTHLQAELRWTWLP